MLDLSEPKGTGRVNRTHNDAAITDAIETSTNNESPRTPSGLDRPQERKGAARRDRCQRKSLGRSSMGLESPHRTGPFFGQRILHA